MPTAENAQISYESGQDYVAMAELTDAGDHLKFECSDPIWSNRSGYKPDVKPNGLASGGVVIPAVSGTDNLVDVAALVCYLAGVKTTVNADTDVACTRPAGDVSKVNSITVTDAGAIAAVAGVDGATTAFSTTRGAAGGPPLIPVGSIEIGQVRWTTTADAAVTADEIYQVPGTHVEYYNFPGWTINYVDVENGVIGNAGITFDSALPLIHTGAVAKKVYAEYYEPIFSVLSKTENFVPPQTTHSVSSKQVYRKTLGSKTSSLGQGSFTVYLEDGISDPFLDMKDEEIWFKFYTDPAEDPYILARGHLGISRSFPAGDQISAACTISAEEAAYDVEG